MEIKTLNEGYFKRDGAKDSKINTACSKKYKVDVLALGEVYKRNNYKEWKKISKNWDQDENYFSNADINVYVHLVIEHSGSALPKRVK